MITEELQQTLTQFAALEKDWDGYGASSIEARVITNAHNFLTTLLREFPNLQITGEDLSPTPYGSIVVDIEVTEKGLVSVEIGREHIGYFTKYKGGKEDIISDIEPSDFLSLSSLLRQAISNLL